MGESIFDQNGVLVMYRRATTKGTVAIERGCRVTLPFTAIEDEDEFHRLCEILRLDMIEALRATGAPINVWRTGQLVGTPHASVDEHMVELRTRTATE
jgi:hypothetical protein